MNQHELTIMNYCNHYELTINQLPIENIINHYELTILINH